MVAHPTAAAPAATSGYTVTITDDPTLLAAARRLRHDILGGAPGSAGGLVPRPRSGANPLGDGPLGDGPLGDGPPGDGPEPDDFDEHCDHLVISDGAGAVVGTCRLLRPGGAAAAGRRPGDEVFNMSALRPLRDLLVEADGLCVHPGHRSAAVVNLMSVGIARFLHLNNLRWVGGRVGVPLGDGGAAAGAAWREASGHLAPPALRVQPRRPWPGPAGDARTGRVPPQVRGFLRLGAWVCGEPGYDRGRNTADLYVLLSLDRLSPRHRRHYLGATR